MNLILLKPESYLLRKQLYAYLATLGATSSITEFDKVCTQFEKKPAVHSAGHLVLPSSVMKVCTQYLENQLYTYKACKSRPSHFHVFTD